MNKEDINRAIEYSHLDEHSLSNNEMLDILYKCDLSTWIVDPDNVVKLSILSISPMFQTLLLIKERYLLLISFQGK